MHRKAAAVLFASSLLLSVQAKTFSEERVADAIMEQSEKYHIDPSILFTIGSVESDFEPLAIAVETTQESARVLSALRSDSIRVVFGDRKTYHSRRSIISLYPKDLETANYVIALLEKYGFCFDVGLMQINTVNFTLDEVRQMFLPENNVAKAASVYNVCRKHFKTLKNRVECYNRGAGNLKSALAKKNHSYYPYWKRFKRHYTRYFGKIPKDVR